MLYLKIEKKSKLQKGVLFCFQTVNDQISEWENRVNSVACLLG